MFLIDLRDAYLQIPIQLDSRLYLRITLEGKIYELKALCFGLTTAPQVLTRVFVLVLEGDSVPALFGRLVGDCRVNPSPPAALGVTSPALLGPGDCAAQYRR